MGTTRRAYSIFSLLALTLAIGMVFAGYRRFSWYGLGVDAYVGGALMFVVGCSVGRIVAFEPVPKWSMFIVNLVAFSCIANGTIPDRGNGVVLWSLSCAAAGIVVGTCLLPPNQPDDNVDSFFEADSLVGKQKTTKTR